MYYIYILHSPSADRYYVGYTQDYQARLEQHNVSDRTDTFTSKHRPWELAAVFACGEDRTFAVRVERFIKKQKSRKLIEGLLDVKFVPTQELGSLVRVNYLQDYQEGINFVQVGSENRNLLRLAW